MLTVTKAAGARLAEKLAEKSAGDDVALRFIRQEKRRRWTLRLDNPGPSDAAFSYDGRIVLVLDEPSSQLLRNRMLDIRDTDEGPRLRLCGGGSSTADLDMHEREVGSQRHAPGLSGEVPSAGEYGPTFDSTGNNLRR